ncbi:hypothetical protein TruAng_010650 [Truncatella angustata]|nr:hypothetical protein TruAng_010650 [Truncatella angustata]
MKSNNSVSRRDDNNIPDGATATYLMHVMMEHLEATSERTTEHIESMKETFDRTTERILGIMERLEAMLQEQKAKNVREAKSMKRSDKKEEKAHVQ